MKNRIKIWWEKLCFKYTKTHISWDFGEESATVVHFKKFKGKYYIVYARHIPVKKKDPA